MSSTVRSDQIVCKLKFNGGMHRFSIPISSFTATSLSAKIQGINSQHINFDVFYKDNDGENVIFSAEAEVKEMLYQHMDSGDACLRLETAEKKADGLKENVSSIRPRDILQSSDPAQLQKKVDVSVENREIGHGSENDSAEKKADDVGLKEKLDSIRPRDVLQLSDPAQLKEKVDVSVENRKIGHGSENDSAEKKADDVGLNENLDNIRPHDISQSSDPEQLKEIVDVTVENREIDHGSENDSVVYETPFGSPDVTLNPEEVANEMQFTVTGSEVKSPSSDQFEVEKSAAEMMVLDSAAEHEGKELFGKVCHLYEIAEWSQLCFTNSIQMCSIHIIEDREKFICRAITLAKGEKKAEFLIKRGMGVLKLSDYPEACLWRCKSLEGEAKIYCAQFGKEADAKEFSGMFKSIVKIG